MLRSIRLYSLSLSLSLSLQDLLSLFGLPYVVSPSEAEAQCAALEACQLTQGSITDDNDVFLFGGERVYRNFFSQDKDVELYQGREIETILGQLSHFFFSSTVAWTLLGPRRSVLVKEVS